MKAEHLTFMGDSLVRDSQDIALHTLKAFENLDSDSLFQVPNTSLQIKTTVAGEGAMFDIMKGEDTFFVNVCSFGNPEMLNYVKHLAENTVGKLMGGNVLVREPKEPYWLYTIPVINPFTILKLSTQEMMICGEIEFYIYYHLYRKYFV